MTQPSLLKDIGNMFILLAYESYALPRILLKYVVVELYEYFDYNFFDSDFAIYVEGIKRFPGSDAQPNFETCEYPQHDEDAPDRATVRDALYELLEIASFDSAEWYNDLLIAVASFAHSKFSAFDLESITNIINEMF